MLWCKRCAIPALPCKLAAVDPQNALVEEGVLSCLHARSCCCDPQNALVEEGVLSCAAMQACCDSQNALVEEGCAIPALPCKLAAVVIHRTLVQGRVCYPAVMQQAAVMIHRMLWWKKGVLSLRCHASSLLL
jgi:hypothetical protein